MRFAVIVFPGSNCDTDIYHAIKDVLHEEAEFVRHDDASLEGYDAVILPGGFSYGDYLRCGAMAALSNIAQEIKRFASLGKPVLGVCNGFQILTELGLLPGALKRNENKNFICKTIAVKVLNKNMFTSLYEDAETINLPIAHGEGMYTADEETIKYLHEKNLIVFKYVENPNGSTNEIAGIINEQGNVLGMMPHPERAVESLLGNDDGLRLFKSVINTWKENQINQIKNKSNDIKALDLGEGCALVVKTSSLRQPISPQKEAAAGVGEIVRDTYSLGARPIALLNSLKFGELDELGNKHIFKDVVRGIASYGNCIGVPTVGGEIGFHQTGETIINAMCLGLVKHDGFDKMTEDKLIYINTGRGEFLNKTKNSKEVYESDPFMEKLLMETSLESIKYPARFVKPAHEKIQIDFSTSVLDNNVETLIEAPDYSKTLIYLLSQSSIASKHFAYSQFDQMVNTNTIVPPGSDAAVLRIRGIKKAIALTTDCNNNYVKLDSQLGGKIAVAEAVRNITATGGKAVAVACITSDELFSRGVKEACYSLNIQIIDEEESIGTPFVGVIGVVDDYSKITTQFFKHVGDLIYILGETTADYGGSEIQKMQHGKISGLPPNIDLDKEKQANNIVYTAIEKGLVNSAHDVSDGGIGVALIEKLIKNKSFGAEINIEASDATAFLFSETQSRYIVSVPPKNQNEFEALSGIKKSGVVTGNGELKIIVNSAEVINSPVDVLINAWENAIEYQL